jgi:hypothetical protein
MKEANAKIAESLGWELNPYNTKFYLRDYDYMHVSEIPDYFSPSLPVATRLEMWEALNKLERLKLIELVLSGPNLDGRGIMERIVYLALSPEFVPAWCKIRLGLEVL